MNLKSNRKDDNRVGKNRIENKNKIEKTRIQKQQNRIEYITIYFPKFEFRIELIQIQISIEIIRTEQKII